MSQKRVLLTGATGFLGSHLLETLLKQDYKVVILKRSTSDTWRINHLIEQVKSYDVDVVEMERAFEEQKINIVIHTACNYGRHGQPVHEMAQANLVFGLRVIDAAIHFNTDTFLNTDTFFNTNTSLPQYLGTYTLCKKQFTEWLVLKSNEIRVVNLKLQHVYGPKDGQDKFATWVLNQFEQNVKRIPLTEGSQLRDFIYIDDVVSAYMLAFQECDHFEHFSTFDVGTGDLNSVKAFVTSLHAAYKQLHPDNETVLGFGDLVMQAGEVKSAKADTSGLKRLGWSAKVSWEEGVKKLLAKRIGWNR